MYVLLLLPACYLSHEVGADAARDASVDARRDTGTVDTGTVDTGLRDTGLRDTGAVDTGAVDTGAVDTGAPACVDPTIPASADGCCEMDRQACTHDCGSFVIFCNEGCCNFTGP